MKLVKLASNFHVVTSLFSSKAKTFWFSYDTLIAFETAEPKKLYIIENCWKSTTGKHLNSINDDKSIRLSKIDFEKAMKKFNL